MFRGVGRLAGTRMVEVTGNDETRQLTARRAVLLATGTVAAVPRRSTACATRVHGTTGAPPRRPTCRTDPRICAVGLTEQQARDAGLPARGVTYGTGDVPGAQMQGSGITGTSKLVIDSERSVIVGAAFVGPGVQELLRAATVAIVGGVPPDQLWHAAPSFPTVSEVWLHMLEQCGL